MAKKSFIQKIKDLFTGGGSSSGGGRSSSGGSSGGSRKRSSGSYYGGGYSSSYRSYGSSSREDEKEKQRQKIKEQNKQTTAKLAAIAKVSQRTDALSSGKKSLPPEPKALANNGISPASIQYQKMEQNVYKASDRLNKLSTNSSTASFSSSMECGAAASPVAASASSHISAPLSGSFSEKS